MTANKYRGTIKLSNHYFGGGGGLVTQTLWTVACQARLSMGFQGIFPIPRNQTWVSCIAGGFFNN